MKNTILDKAYDVAIAHFMENQAEHTAEIIQSLYSRNIPTSLELLIKKEMQSQRKKEDVKTVKGLYTLQQQEQKKILGSQTLETVVAELESKRKALAGLKEQHAALLAHKESLTNKYNHSSKVNDNHFYNEIQSKYGLYLPNKAQYYNLAAQIHKFPHQKSELFQLLNSLYIFQGEIGIFYSTNRVVRSDLWDEKIHDVIAKLYWLEQVKFKEQEIHNSSTHLVKLQKDVEQLEHVVSLGRPTKSSSKMREMLSSVYLTTYQQQMKRLDAQFDYDQLDTNEQAKIYSSLIQVLRPELETDERFALVLKKFDHDETQKIKPLQDKKTAILRVLAMKKLSFDSSDLSQRDKISRLEVLTKMITQFAISPKTQSNELVEIISSWCALESNRKRNQDLFKASTLSKFFPCIPHQDDGFIKECIQLASKDEESPEEQDSVVMRRA